MHHYLRPLVRPESVALIGASDREGSIGRTTYQNLLAGGYAGALYAVNPNHQTMFDRPVYGSLVDIGEPVELVIVAAPAAAVPRIIEEAGAVKAKAAVLMTTPPVGDARLARRWSREVLANARAKNIRVVGAGALGVIRTDIGLNATFCAPPALVGRLAIIAQSGAVATALLDFAATLGIGFSTVISLGGEMDVGFGELLDCMLLDSATDGILLYIEEVHDARSFLSALRAAARVKPVVVLKAGKSVEPHRDPSADAVFDAALRRAGTVRVHTYTQLFAAARILASGRIPQGDRIAIVSNGRGPALLAADSVAERGVTLATLTPATVAALDTVLPVESVRTNPVDVRGDARAERFATAVQLMLDDEQVDAVLALHVPRPISGATEVAQAIADVARKSRKPILAAWLGAINRREVHAALASGGIADFYTPENAIDAFAFLAAYRRNQAWLLEVPPPAPEPEPPHLDAAEEVRTLLAAEARSQLTIGESYTLLTAFGMTPLPFALVATRPDAELAAKRLHFPVSLSLDAYDVHEGITGIRTRRSLSKAWDRLLRTAESAPPVGWNGYTLITRDIPRSGAANIAIAVASDPVFGPVIMLGPSLPVRPPHRAETLMLPPLNRRLAGDLIANVPELGLADSGSPGGSGEALARLLTQLSALVCALPWVHELVLDPVIMVDGTPIIVAARMAVDPKRKLQPAYRHMAIHPYPTELIAEVKLRDGTPLLIRPIRPEDAELEREFVHSLSDESRYFRFFYRLSELTPGMLARFTQVDYDREVALVAVADDATSTHREFVGVARYITNPDQESAEFAVVIADAWQRRGVARILMERLMASAKKGGLKRLEGAVLRANRKMLDFVISLGFTTHEDPEDSDQVIAVRIL